MVILHRFSTPYTYIPLKTPPLGGPKLGLEGDIWFSLGTNLVQAGGQKLALGIWGAKMGPEAGKAPPKHSRVVLPLLPLAFFAIFFVFHIRFGVPFWATCLIFFGTRFLRGFLVDFRPDLGLILGP